MINQNHHKLILVKIKSNNRNNKKNLWNKTGQNKINIRFKKNVIKLLREQNRLQIIKLKI